MMELGQKYNVVYGEDMNGNFDSEEMTLVEIKSYKGKEIYIFNDSNGYVTVSYNHDGKNIDWDFMNEIYDKFE